MSGAATAQEIRAVNTRYHDAAAEDYDTKWGIDFGAVGRRQVVGKLTKALGHPPAPVPRALEIGSGTGYFTLNLMRAGVIGDAVATDISPGMLAALEGNAARLGLPVTTVATDAERLPFDDATFDLVHGHAVLHHIPDPVRAFEEFRRVLRPGGVVAFMGEPSRHGDRIAALPKRAAVAAAPLWRAAMRAPAIDRGNGIAPPPDDDHALEWVVDVHAFTPGALGTLPRTAGFEAVEVRGEELLANAFGWVNRTLESTAEPDAIPWLWRQYAFRGYQALQEVDRRLLERRLPPALFYNLMVTARRPA